MPVRFNDYPVIHEDLSESKNFIFFVSSYIALLFDKPKSIFSDLYLLFILSQIPLLIFQKDNIFDKNGIIYELHEFFNAYIFFGNIPSIVDVGLAQEKGLSLLENTMYPSAGK